LQRYHNPAVLPSINKNTLGAALHVVLALTGHTALSTHVESPT